MNKQRERQIEIMRGIAIIFMVLGHSGFRYTDFLYLFHMAFFFIASGYCYKTYSSDSFQNLIKFIWKRIQSLWFVYVVWNSIFVLLNNAFIELNIYTDDVAFLESVDGFFVTLHHKLTIKEMIIEILKTLLFGGGTTLGGAFWFFESLFMISCAYVFIDYVIKKLIKKEKIVLIYQATISIVFLLIGFGFHLIDFNKLGIDRMLSYYWLFYVGTMIKRFSIDRIWVKNNILSFIISFGLLIVCMQFGTIYLDTNRYINPFFFIVASLLGWIFLRCAAQVLEKKKIIRELLCIIGRNSIAIVILHFLCFKIVSFIGIIINNEPGFWLAAFPVLYEGGFWWIAYTIVGVVIPVSLNEFRKYVISKNYNYTSR